MKKIFLPMRSYRISRLTVVACLCLLGTYGKIATAQTLTTLYQFGALPTDGTSPQAGLVQGSDGYFYGTTEGGGTNLAVFKANCSGTITRTNGLGTVFRISSVGTLTTLYEFRGSDGAGPDAGLVQGSDGYFYGTTSLGGTNFGAVVIKMGNTNSPGTVFRISSAGTLTTLYEFGGRDGSVPEAGLVQGSDGNFYGTTFWGGTNLAAFNMGCGPVTNGLGTVFRISSAGTLTTLYEFGGVATAGTEPSAGLVQGIDGNFYGTTSAGGTNGDNGTVFRILSPQNSWTNAGSGKWESATNWSLGRAPSASDGADFITNASTKTVTIDAATATNQGGIHMKIYNLAVSAPSGATNTLFLNSAGTGTPLRVMNVLVLGTNGAMVVNNSAVQSANSVSIGNPSASSSLVLSNGGSLIVTNGIGTGSVVVNGGSLILGAGTFKTDNLIVTNGGAVQYTQTYEVNIGTVTVAGGTVQAGSNLVIAATANSTSTVLVVGGTLVATNGTLSVGNDGTITSGGGVGLVTVSNGTLLATTILLGSSAGGQGNLILGAGGTISCPAGTNCLISINSLGFDQIGGDLVWANSTLECGVTSPGDYSVSNGTANFQDLYAGYSDVGTMTMAGGVASISSHLIVGYLGPPSLSTGAVWVTGGQLTIADYSIIGNSGTGQMSISNGIVTAADVFVGNSSNPGTLTLAGGTLTVNSLVLLNPSSQFNFTGGWLNALGITNSNGQTLTLGTGVSPITLNLLGGISSLGNGLMLSANATLTGCGTINGNVTIDSGGTVLASCGTLTFVGIVTNNGTMRANGGCVLESYGTVVNNGTIDIINGTTNFHSGFVNNGTVLTASSVKISQVSKSGQDMVIQIPSVTGHTYQLQYTTSLTPATWTPTGASQSGNGGVLTFTDSDGAANPQRFYRVAVTAP